MKPWLEDVGAIWRGRLIPEMMKSFDKLKAVDLPALSNIGLLEQWESFLAVMQRCWEIHFYPMYAAFMAYKELRALTSVHLGFDEDDNRFKTLMTGFTTIAYEVDRRLWALSQAAGEMGLTKLFEGTTDDGRLLQELETGEAGRSWLKLFDVFLQEHGYRADTLLDICSPSWIEKPSLAIPTIRGNLGRPGGFAVDAEQQEAAQKREALQRELMEQVPAGLRERFGKVLRTAQWTSVFSEEHDYYIDLYMCALGRRVLVEIGQRAVREGLLDDPDDVNFLMPEEIVRMLSNMETNAFRKVVGIRRGEWQGFIEKAPGMLSERLMIGDPGWFIENLSREPIMWIFAGAPKVNEELAADLYGIASAPGVVEGFARVLLDPAQLGELQPGEILVVPSTNPAWNPAFNFIKGAVTEAGGALSHAVIVAREYGLPCVAGAEGATQKIKTGDRIRVDGDNYAVYIVSRA
jgi:pyruvate,water dikinase